LVFEINPLGKILALFVLELVTAPESVPLPYGAGPETEVLTGTGTTVWVLNIMTGDSVVAASPALFLTGKELTAPSAEPAGVGVAVSVTVTVDKATVTVTGVQPSAPLPPAPVAAASRPPAAEEAATTVIYLVEVLVPVRVVVDSVSTLPSFAVTPAFSPVSPGRVAYTVAVLVCLIVVVTTVVEVPVPSVYVRTTDSSPDDAPVGAGPLLPVPRGTAGDVTPPAAMFVAVAEYEAWAAELADSACSTGQTVVVMAMTSVTTAGDVLAGQSVMLAAQLVMV